MHMHANLKALRTAAPYIRAYRGRIFVVKLGGRLCEPGPVLENLADQLAVLHRFGIRLVVVHGGGPQADLLGQRLGVEPRVVGGRRVTDAATLEVVKMAFAGAVNTDLVTALVRQDVPAVGLRALDGGLVAARRRPPGEIPSGDSRPPTRVDFGYVGDIVGVRPEPLLHLMDGGYVPVVCPLAADDAGQVLNINADTVAARLAAALGAAKYFLVTNVDGVMRDPGDPSTLQSYLDLEQLEALLASGAVTGGMLPKLAACQEALRAGIPRVHIVNGLVPDTLLGEVFTNEGCGTLLVAKRETESVGQGTA